MTKPVILACMLGAVSAGAAEMTDLPGFIAERVAAGDRRIVIPPGRYRVTPVRSQHLVLARLRDVEIVAEGVEMVCTETTRAITLQDCTNVMVRGLVIDYDPLPFTQGRLVAISADGRTHEIELFDGYPAADTAIASKYEIFRPDTRTLRCGEYYGFTVEAMGARRLRIVKPGGAREVPERAGDLVVVASRHAPGGEAPHAVYLDRCEGIVLEDIRLYASNCFGFLETACRGTTYRRCAVDRRPPESDPVRRADPRLRSLNADAFHSKHATAGPSYLDCTARFQGDDCIAVNGDYHLVMACTGTTLRVLGKHGIDIRPGDDLEVVTYEGMRLPDARAVTIAEAGAIRDEERAFLLHQRMDEGLRTRMLARAWMVATDRPLDLPRGSVIAAAGRIGSGFRVIGGTFGYNRSRGIIAKASHGEIRGATLEGCAMASILISPEYWWLEAGSSDDVAILGNTIRKGGRTAIEVSAEGGKGQLAPAGAHHRITIRDNRVEGGPMPAIRVTSTRGLDLGANVLEPPPADPAGAVKLESVEPLP